MSALTANQQTLHAVEVLARRSLGAPELSVTVLQKELAARGLPLSFDEAEGIARRILVAKDFRPATEPVSRTRHNAARD